MVERDAKHSGVCHSQLHMGIEISMYLYDILVTRYDIQALLYVRTYESLTISLLSVVATSQIEEVKIGSSIHKQFVENLMRSILEGLHKAKQSELFRSSRENKRR
jgi:hypothetical protein